MTLIDNKCSEQVRHQTFNAWSLTCQETDFLGLETYLASPRHTQSISGRSSRLLLEQASVPPVVGMVEDASCGLSNSMCRPTCSLEKFDRQPPPIPDKLKLTILVYLDSKHL